MAKVNRVVNANRLPYYRSSRSGPHGASATAAKPTVRLTKAVETAGTRSRLALCTASNTVITEPNRETI